MGSGVAKLSNKPPPSKAMKVPLHVAIQAVIILQSNIRMFLARRKLERLRGHTESVKQQAEEYLKSVKKTKINSKNNNNAISNKRLALSRRSITISSDEENFASSATSRRALNTNGTISPKSRRVGTSNASQHFFPAVPQSQSQRIINTMSRKIPPPTALGHGANSSPYNNNLMRSDLTQRLAGNPSTPAATVDVVYPFLGFVIKSRVNATKRKLFLNVCHSPKVSRIICSPVREWVDNIHHDDDGQRVSVDVSIVDVVIPTTIFDEIFVFQEKSSTMIALDEMKRIELATACVAYVNDLYSETKNGIDDSVDDNEDGFGFGIDDNDDQNGTSKQFCSSNFKLPRIKRAYVGILTPLFLTVDDMKEETTVAYLEPFRLSLALSTVGADVNFPPEISYDMAMAWSSFNDTSSLTQSSVKPTANKRNTLSLLDSSDEEDEDETSRELEKHQKEYLANLQRFKNGMNVYVEVTHGVLYIYRHRYGQRPDNTAQSKNTKENASNNASPVRDLRLNEDSNGRVLLPGGEDELVRILLSSYDFSPAIDAKNDLFFLHFDPVLQDEDSGYGANGNPFFIPPTETATGHANDNQTQAFALGMNKSTTVIAPKYQQEPYFGPNDKFPEFGGHTPAMHGRHVNRIHSSVHSSFTLQFRSYSELLAWQMLFEQHVSFLDESRRRWAMNTCQNVRFHRPQHPIFALPIPKGAWIVEKISDQLRRRVFARLDRGYLLLFGSDNINQKPLELILLRGLTLDTQHKKIVRLRKFMTRLLLRPHDAVHANMSSIPGSRQFFIRGDGENDSEIKAFIAGFEQQIDFANAQFTALRVAYLEDAKALQYHHHSHHTILATQVEALITVPDPQTSDDDSDLEERVVRAGVFERFFRVIRPHNYNHNSRPTSLQEGSTASTANTGGKKKTNTNAASSSTSKREVSSGGTSVKESNQLPSINSNSLVGTDSHFFPPTGNSNNSFQDGGDKKDDAILWQELLCQQYDAFPNKPFPCDLLYMAEAKLMLLYFEMKLLAVINVSRCLEKIMKKKERKVDSLLNSHSPLKMADQKTTAKATDGTKAVSGAKAENLYRLESSDDEDDNASDRDYNEFDVDPNLPIPLSLPTTTVLTAKMAELNVIPRMGNTDPAGGPNNILLPIIGHDDPNQYYLELLAYDGRTYRLKMKCRADYESWLSIIVPNKLSLDGSIITGGGFHPVHPLLSPGQPGTESSSISRQSSNMSVKEDQLLRPELVSDDERSSTAGRNDARNAVIDNEATKKYTKSLRANEKVLGCGIVLKHEKVMAQVQAASAPKQRRILLVTDLPRMIFIDTIGSIVRGHLELQVEAKMDVKAVDGTDFELSVNGTSHRFTVADTPDKDPKFWLNRIHHATSKLI